MHARTRYRVQQDRNLLIFVRACTSGKLLRLLLGKFLSHGGRAGWQRRNGDALDKVCVCMVVALVVVRVCSWDCLVKIWPNMGFLARAPLTSLSQDINTMATSASVVLSLYSRSGSRCTFSVLPSRWSSSSMLAQSSRFVTTKVHALF